MKNIKDLLPSVFSKKPRLQRRFELFLLKKMLKEKFGIEDISLEKGILEIKASKSALLQELSFKKEEIKEEINKIAKQNLIKKIFFKRRRDNQKS